MNIPQRGYLTGCLEQDEFAKLIPQYNQDGTQTLAQSDVRTERPPAPISRVSH